MSKTSTLKTSCSEDVSVDPGIAQTATGGLRRRDAEGASKSFGGSRSLRVAVTRGLLARAFLWALRMGPQLL